MLLGISKMSFKEKSIATTLRTLSARAATRGNRQESQPQLHLGTPQHRMDQLPLGELYLRQLLVGLHLRQPEVLRLLPYPLFLRLHHPQGEVMVLVCGIFFVPVVCMYYEKQIRKNVVRNLEHIIPKGWNAIKRCWERLGFICDKIYNAVCN